MAISRAQLQKELIPGLHKLFGLEYKTYPEEWSKLYETYTSERAWEEELKLSGFNMARVKNEGESVEFDNAQEVWSARYTHQTITLGFSITEEAMEDDLYDSLSVRYTKALARSMAYTKEVKAAEPLNNGFTTYQSGDGTTLFSTSHTTVSGLTNANTPAVAVDLNETAIENMYIQMAAWVDERGLLIMAKPKMLIVPPANNFVAERLLKSNYRVETADNDINALLTVGVFPKGYMVDHFLTAPTSWYVCSDVPNGLTHFERTPLKTSTEDDFTTGNILYKARNRYSFGVTDYLGVWGVVGP